MAIINGIELKSGGIHTQRTPQSGMATSAATAVSTTTVFSSNISQLVVAYPYIPYQNISYSSLYINVATPSAGSLVRVLIYSNLNSLPYNKLFESSNLDCSTGGKKTINTSGTFIAGTTYWLGIHGNSTPCSLSAIRSTDTIPIGYSGTNIYNCVQATSGQFSTSSPSPFTPTVTNSNFTIPFIWITIT